VKAAKLDKQDTMEMNLVPMIDIIFNLLVFFILSSEMASLDHIANLKLPMASEAKPEDKRPDRMVINVDGNSNIIIGGRTMKSLNDLSRVLAAAKRTADAEQRRGNASQPILINADRNVPWQKIQDIMETAAKHKLSQLSFATKKGDKEE